MIADVVGQRKLLWAIFALHWQMLAAILPAEQKPAILEVSAELDSY